MMVRRVGRRWRPGRFLTGALVGVVLVFVGRLAINKTPLADWLISPLLVSDSTGKAEALVVLGAGAVGDCGLNNNSVRRVLYAARLWREQRAPVLLFTGGTSDGTCPVAVAMAQLAREVGVPEQVIRLETASRSTHENAEQSAPVLRSLGARRILLVTDRLHMPRAVGVFERAGFEVERVSVPIYEGHGNNVGMLAAGIREGVALAYYRLRGWVGSGFPRAADQSHTRTAAAGMHAAGTTGGGMQASESGASGPIVIHGASYAGGWELASLGGVPVVNRGISGQQTAELLERFERDVVAAKPRAVILWGFINDIFRAAPTDMDAALARIRDSYTKMIARARQAGIEPIVATEVTIRPLDTWSEMILGPMGRMLGKESNSERINRHVMDVNRWLIDLAARERLQVLDFQAVLAEEPGGRRRREFSKEDGSHITPAGYAAITAYAVPKLEEYLMKPGSGR